MFQKSNILSKSSLFFLLFLGGFLTVALQSCSDDIDVRSGYINTTDNDNILYLYLPDIEVVKTRSFDNQCERQINNMSLLFYKGSTLEYRKDLDDNMIEHINTSINSSDRICTLTLKLPDNINTSEFDIYAIANTIIEKSTDEEQTIDLLSDFTVGGDNSSLDLLLSKTSETFYDIKQGRLMSGKVVDKTINLNRVSAKLSLTDSFNNPNLFELLDEETSDHITYGGFSIYYSAADCFLMAPIKDKTPFFTENLRSKDNPILAQKLVDNEVVRYDAYALPTKTFSELYVNTYVIIHAKYKGEKCYYAIPLYDSDKDEFLDIKPNHWYQMEITDVSVKGYKDVETAIKNHTTNQITVQIHDHAQEVLSMVSDGIHELGVTHNLELDMTNSTKTFVVKCFAADSDKFDPKDLEVTIIEGKDWLELSPEPEKILQKESTDDSDSFGTQFRYTVKVPAAGTLYTDQQAIILVSYRGLSREINVTYNSSFTPQLVSDVTLTIKNYETDHRGENYINEITIKDYWSFISGNGETYSMSSSDVGYENTPRLFGIKPNEMPDDRVRNEGFHFPMPYGYLRTSEYEYTINFTKLKDRHDNDENAQKIVKITPSISNNQPKNTFITDNITVSEAPDFSEKANQSWTFTLKMKSPPENDKYKYALGKIRFTVEYEDENTSELNFDIYHTGFFHYVGQSMESYYPNDTDWGYYYYAVPTLNGTPWLDRNIGAKSSKRFGSRADNGHIGEPEAGGKYFTIASTKDFDDPDIVEDMCPPGYHIPSSSEWNEIRLSDKFKTVNRNVDNQIYMSTFFDTGDDQMGDVFFQKGRFYNYTNTYSLDDKAVDANSANSGDDLSGYYWTRTVAPAMEKEQMGKWLRVLYFNGASTSYNNGSINDHKYYVRCKAGEEPDDQIDYYVSFSVHNATHAYLFAYDNKTGSTTALYTFPGKAIGSEISAEIWQYFYCTTSINTNKLYVVFVKIKSIGYDVFTKNGNSFDINSSFDDSLLTPETAWSIEEYNHKYFDFCDPYISEDNENSNIYESEDNIKEEGVCTNPPGSISTPGGSYTGKFEKELEEEIILFNDKKVFTSFNDNNSKLQLNSKSTNSDIANLEVNWTNYPVGSTLKLYVYGSKFDLQLFYGSWGSMLKQYKSYPDVSEKDSELGVIEIPLTGNLKPDILAGNDKNGLIIQGENFELIAITIIRGDGTEPDPEPLPDFNPEDDREKVLWQGSVDLIEWSSSKVELKKATNVDWSIYAVGSIVKAYYTSSNDGVVAKVAYDNSGWKDIYSDTEINNHIHDYNDMKVIEFTLTDEILNYFLRNDSGLIFYGNNATALAVTIINKEVSPESTDNVVSEFDPDNPSEQIIWKGSHDFDKNHDFYDLSDYIVNVNEGYSIFKWTSIPPGVSAILRIYYNSEWELNSITIKTCTGGPITIAYKNSDNFKKTSERYEIILSNDNMNLIKNNEGIVINAYGFIMEKITIQKVE